MSSPPLWTRRIADEFWSGPVTPLTFSLLAETMAEHMVRRPLHLAGLGALAELPVLRRHASHVYVNVALLTEVIERLPAAFRSGGLLDLLPAPARAGLGTTSAFVAGPRAAAIVARLLVYEREWVPWQRAAAFERACAQVRERFGAMPPPPRDTGPEVLRAEMARVRDQLGDYLRTVSWGIVFAYVFYHLTTELARRWAPDLVTERAALTVGLPGVRSHDAAREIATLAELLAADARLAALAHDSGPAAAWAAIAADTGALGQAFRVFLARHGHRLSGRDLACPTWCEAPAIVVGLAARRVSHAATADARRTEATAAIERAIDGGMLGVARRTCFRAALAGAQRYYVVRENMRYHADYFLARLRQLALALGAQLAASGRIATAADVCFLDFDELGAACAGPGALADTIAARRAALERDGLAPPSIVIGDPAADLPPAADGDTRLHGEAGAPGSCRARARLIRGPADFELVEVGDVVVAAYADPGWMPVLELAGGLVLEAGGQLSHGAIVARELGIPALVNVADATRVIRTGDTLQLDATSGHVTIVARG
jgi:pyruvate,water dikinase